MRVIRGIENLPFDLAGCVVGLGMFDGVHVGHREILRRTVTLAKARGVEAVALTFDRHPLEVLAPNKAPALLSTLDEKVGLIAENGLDTLVVARFDRKFAVMPPHEFAGDVIAARFKAIAVVIGFNYSFGYRGTGNPHTLQDLGRIFGFDVDIVEPVKVRRAIVGSTAIRALIGSGRVDEAATMLGRPFVLSGMVIGGEGQGRALGYPTANLDVDRGKIVPKDGVYAAYVVMGNLRLPGVVNVGSRPTFDGKTRTIEVHIFNFGENIYGERISLEFIKYLRKEIKFHGPEALVAQIERDIAATRMLLSFDARVSTVYNAIDL